ncbi:MAG: hypothetical protein IKA78_05540 [Oscillospiraceae bacterium]|nr:hypothetical protein [Oscillospiraceae bacterium]
MKAIVLENRDGFSVLLRDDGEIVKLRMQAQIGETVELSDESLPLRSAKSPWVRTAVAASLALVIAGGSYAYVAVPASAFVSLDAGESSVELAVNRLGRIVSVRPKNKASVALSDELAEDIRGKQMDDGIRKTVQCLQDDGALSGEDGCLIAGVTSNAPTTESAITEIVEEVTTSDGEEAVELYTITVTEEERQEAEENDQSAGSYAFNRRNMRRIKRRKERREQRRIEAEETNAQLQTAEAEQTAVVTETADAVQSPAAAEVPQQPVSAQPAEPAAVVTEAPVSQVTEEASEPASTDTEEYVSDVPEFTEEKQERKDAKKEERRRRRKLKRKLQRQKERQAKREAQTEQEAFPQTELSDSES